MGVGTRAEGERRKAGASKAAHKELMWPPHSLGLLSESL